MRKKVAVVVTNRQQEALRMAVGLTLADNKVAVFVVNHPLEQGAMTDLNIQMLGEMGAELIAVSADELARKLPSYDAVIPY